MSFSGLQDCNGESATFTLHQRLSDTRLKIKTLEKKIEGRSLTKDIVAYAEVTGSLLAQADALERMIRGHQPFPADRALYLTHLKNCLAAATKELEQAKLRGYIFYVESGQTPDGVLQPDSLVLERLSTLACKFADAENRERRAALVHEINVALAKLTFSEIPGGQKDMVRAAREAVRTVWMEENVRNLLFSVRRLLCSPGGDGGAPPIPPPAADTGITVDETTITGGTDGRVLYDNGGLVGEAAELLYDDATGLTQFKVITIPTGALPASGAAMDGRILLEDTGGVQFNLIYYAGGRRFRLVGANF